jgi:DNA repair/transcription protein MET18/MMS19
MPTATSPIDHETAIQTLMRAFQSERDPRNLIVLFRMHHFVSTNWLDSSIDDALVESLFDAIACYYPISFHAPVNNPYNITPEALKIGLR